MSEGFDFQNKPETENVKLTRMRKVTPVQIFLSFSQSFIYNSGLESATIMLIHSHFALVCTRGHSLKGAPWEWFYLRPTSAWGPDITCLNFYMLKSKLRALL